ncbi:MAG: cell division ATP-binding protein FtsE [Betaproteobacteria bacterium]|nr:cell division ATP-binding protein FtsE [Betaproteobacteria bacterium]
MIETENLSKRYPGGHQALKNISISIREGEMVFLTGHSGAGKSTLMKLIGGIEKATNGSVAINGTKISQLSRSALPYLRRNFGFVFQDHKLLLDRSVFHNVALPLLISGFSKLEVSTRVTAALDKVGLLNKEALNPLTLSGGEQQRLCIARAVVNKPAILLADEPTGNLDPGYAADIVAMFRAFNRVGVTVIIATHDPAMIEGLGARVISLKQGELEP